MIKQKRLSIKSLMAILGFAAVNALFVANVTGVSYAADSMMHGGAYSESSISLGHQMAQNDTR